MSDVILRSINFEDKVESILKDFTPKAISVEQTVGFYQGYALSIKVDLINGKVSEGPNCDWEAEFERAEERSQDAQRRLDKAEILLKTVRERNVYVETMLAKLIG